MKREAGPTPGIVEFGEPPGGVVERRTWIALAVSTLATLLTTIDISIVNVAFPSMRRDLGASETGLSWVLSGYSIASGAFLMLAGRLADQKVDVVFFWPGSRCLWLARSYRVLRRTRAC